MRRHQPPVFLSLALLGLLALSFAVPAEAAIHYQASTTVEAEGQKAQRTRVEAWVDGPNAKVVFAESGVPTMEKGQYLLTSDGGETLFLVDPEEETYAQWDLEAMMQALGSIMQSIQPLVNLEIENVEVVKLSSEAGGTMVGLPTTHTRHRTAYDMRIKVFGMSRNNRVETLQDTWSTGELEDVGLGIWLRKAPTTGFGELDELVRAEMAAVEGFPLKSVAVSTTTGQKGKQTTSTTTMEVTSLDRSVSVPASTFDLPAGYSRVEMAPEGEDGEKNPLSGIFGG